MADVNKAAQDKATSDHASGQSAPNTSSWEHSVRDAYHTQRDYLKREEEAKKNNS